MLWEEMAKYTELTGEDGTHVPIMKLGAYLDGYEKGKEVLDKIRNEVCDIDDEIVLNPDSFYERKVYIRFYKVIDIIDKYKAEGSGEE